MNTQYIPHPSDFDRLDTMAATITHPVITLNQRTPEWYAARRGRFTGSEVWKLMTDPRSKSEAISQTALTYIREKLAETITGITPEVSSASMQWGTDNEPLAIARYAERYDVNIEPADFVPWGQYGGGSPDGYADQFGILEVKCPYNSAIHLENMINARQHLTAQQFKDNYKEYYWQIQNNLMVTGRKEAHFVSFDPRFPEDKQLAYIIVPAVDEDIERLQQRIEGAATILHQMKIALGIF